MGYSASDLIAACTVGNLSEAERILADGSQNVNATDEDGNSPLMFAVQSRNIDLIRLLIQHGANVSQTNTVNYCPLVVAVMSENTQAVEALLAAGAIVDKDNDWIAKSIQFAKNNDLHAINQLLEAQAAKLEAAESEASVPAALSQEEKDAIYQQLFDATTENEYDTFTALYTKHESWLNINQKINDGQTLLWNSIDDGERRKLVDFLLERSANPNIVSNSGSSPFTLAFGPNYGSNVELVKLLVEHGANVNAKDGGGFTALMYFSSYGNLNMVKYLLSKNANPDLSSNNGYTALDLAERDNHTEVVKLLKNPAKARQQKTVPSKPSAAAAGSKAAAVKSDTQKKIPMTKGYKTAMWIFSILGGLIGLILTQQAIKSPVYDDASIKSAKVARVICFIVIILSAVVYFSSY